MYRGLARWQAPRDVAELVQPVPGLQAHAPSLRYLLLDQGELLARGDLPPANLATLLFRLEHARDENELRDALQALIDRLDAPAFDELQQAFTAWLRDVLLQERAPGVSIPPVSTLREIETMIVQEKIDWSLRWRQQGHQEGRQEGHRMGVQEGESLLLERLLARRFGALPDEVRLRLSQADTAHLEAWAEKLLDARTLDDVFRH